MNLSTLQLKKLLVDPGFIDSDIFKKAKSEALAGKKDLSDFLISNGLISDNQLGHIFADYKGYSYINLDKEKIDDKIINSIPEIVARENLIIVFGVDETSFKVAANRPEQKELINNLEKKFSKKAKVYFATKKNILNTIRLYKVNLDKEIIGLIEKINTEKLSRSEIDKINVSIVDNILKYAFFSKASDLHIEPLEKDAVVRFRIDGLMHKALQFPKKNLDTMITRIKILAKIRTDEHMSAQDGKFQFNVGKEAIDVRVSIVPVTEGENAVMRLLSTNARKNDFSELGFSSKNLVIIHSAIASPHGMIIVTGPTGSGKTTTLYEILKLLNKPELHIATIEDPVEYDIEGVSQIQVNNKTNLSFASGLRAIVRQDPDIIMVGEIRDIETASIAVNSAMTGHLVLSTLHANDAATAIPRLSEMEVEPFLLVSTLNIVIAQRLARKICQKCRASYSLSKEEEKIFKKDHKLQETLFKIKGDSNLKSLMLFHGEGCKACNQTGYKGRVGIFEILEIGDEIKKLIHNQASSDEIEEKALKSGMVNMLEDGLSKALSGETTLSEVLRVVKI